MSDFQPLNIAVLTVSDSRSETTDESGALLIDRLKAAGHQLADRKILRDDRDLLQAAVAGWVGADRVQVILTTGGTGITGRDVTVDALKPLFDRELEGFGELFRQLSYAQIGAATIQSRACAGLAKGTLIFCLPGSKNACVLAWDKILAPQLDARTQPCNFPMLLPRLRER
ncbi:MAG: molybdenum cofactor biosynthesis protein B [Nevskiales bacterium]